MSIEIILPEPRGFCAGVTMAVESLEHAVNAVEGSVYCFHEIVHNRFIVEQFEKKGVIFVNSVNEVPDGAVLFLSAHGTSPDIKKRAKQKRLVTIDATCPLVTKVHVEAIRFSRQGYDIFYIGHAGHDEVIGTLGEAPDKLHLIEKIEDISQVVLPQTHKLAYLTQTTLSLDETKEIIEALRAQYPQVVGPKKNDICYATQNRQEALREILPQADVLIVIGSQNSSNSQRLKEIGIEMNKPSYLVDQPEQIHKDWFASGQKIVVTSGASAPEALLQSCLNQIRQYHSFEISNFVFRKENVHFMKPAALKHLSS